MSSIITHKIFAEEVLKSMTKHGIRSMIERHPQILYISSNGPDFLFSSYIKPWGSCRSHALNRLGSAMYTHGISVSYETVIECIRVQKHEDVKELMSAYLFSHLYHWALDKTTYSYTFCRTGSCRGVSVSLYHRFESMMNTMMLEKYRDLNIRDYPCYKVCAYDEDILGAIARIYVPAAREVYYRRVKVHDIRGTLNPRYDVQKLPYDPANIKYSLLKGFKTLARKPWAVSGNAVRPPVDERYDVLNEERTIWKRPCDDTIISNASFIDMFSRAIETAVRVIDRAYGCIEYGVDSQSVFEFLRSAAYDTGIDGKRDMKYFDIIYS